ncbi:hypothetical protein HHO41_04820 [Bacillus sp. DNRA2]|uniref:cysteine-rich VLP protein n=1 Tax=Bacillus sp. DNRA2 TaxID=2723053 RepID=UPI00145E83D0|nr:cysteine-rich VLP protein [Bacillus sp. DNRA2]NMD69603.1 hypothetical protein [Bacillus sp. DNRA2]
MNSRELNSIQAKLGRLARNECVNYKDGTCELQRCGACVVTIKTDSLPGNVCRYFMTSVLPADKSLNSEYLGYFPRGYPLKKTKKPSATCHRCGEPFEKTSNAAKYCEDCRSLNERDKARARKQKERRKMSRD